MNRRSAGLLLLPILLFVMSGKAHSFHVIEGAAARQSPFGTLTPEQQKWVENTLAQMTLEEKVGQLLFTTYHGSFTASDSAIYAEKPMADAPPPAHYQEDDYSQWLYKGPTALQKCSVVHGHRKQKSIEVS